MRIATWIANDGEKEERSQEYKEEKAEQEKGEKEKVRGNFSCYREFGVNQLSYANTCQVV